MAAPRDRTDRAEELRQAVRDAGARLGRPVVASGWVPPMDVIERPDGLEVIVDLAGIGDVVRVSVKAGALVIAGDKKPSGACAAGAAFHIAERTFGPFARSIPLRLAFDASNIRATLANGELRIVVPRIDERRGQEIEIPIEIL